MEEAIIKKSDEHSKLVFVGKFAVVVWLLLGLMVLSGGLLTKNITENELGNLFNVLLYPLFFFLLPLLFLKFKLNSGIHGQVIAMITVVAILLTGLAQFGQTYNYFVQTDENINRELDSIAIIYEKKLAILPSINASLKTYNAHELEIMNNIVKGRLQLSEAKNPKEKMTALSNLESLGRNLSINIENYPNLKSADLIVEFINATRGIEEEVRVSKVTYNNNVNAYNRSRKTFPYVFIANTMKLEDKAYFTKLKK